MKGLFEAVIFRDSKLIWNYKKKNTERYTGYYHWHQCCEVLYVHGGSGHVIVNGETYPLREGMLFFFSPYQLHRVDVHVSPSQPYTRTNFFFDPLLIEPMLFAFTKRYKLFKALLEGHSKVKVFDLSSCSDAVERSYESYQSLRSQRRGEDTEEIAMLILHNLNCMLSSSSLTDENPSQGAERQVTGYVQQAMKWIDEHYTEGFQLEDLASALHISKFYLSKYFREETGSTIKEYVTAKRVRLACRLLETTSKSIEIIGNEVGIANSSYFVQVFKQEIGATPLKYRTSFEYGRLADSMQQ